MLSLANFRIQALERSHQAIAEANFLIQNTKEQLPFTRELEELETEAIEEADSDAYGFNLKPYKPNILIHLSDEELALVAMLKEQSRIFDAREDLLKLLKPEKNIKGLITKILPANAYSRTEQAEWCLRSMASSLATIHKVANYIAKTYKQG